MKVLTGSLLLFTIFNKNWKLRSQCSMYYRGQLVIQASQQCMFSLAAAVQCTGRRRLRADADISMSTTWRVQWSRVQKCFFRILLLHSRPQYTVRQRQWSVQGQFSGNCVQIHSHQHVHNLENSMEQGSEVFSQDLAFTLSGIGTTVYRAAATACRCTEISTSKTWGVQWSRIQRLFFNIQPPRLLTNLKNESFPNKAIYS